MKEATKNTETTSEGGVVIFLGTGLNTDSKVLVIHSLAGCLKKLGYGREELGPSRSLGESRWSSGAGHDVT